MRKHICVRPPFSPFATEKKSLLLSEDSPLSALRIPQTPSGIWDNSHYRLFLLPRDLHLSLNGLLSIRICMCSHRLYLKNTNQNKTEKKHIPLDSSQPLLLTAELLQRLTALIISSICPYSLNHCHLAFIPNTASRWITEVTDDHHLATLTGCSPLFLILNLSAAFESQN